MELDAKFENVTVSRWVDEFCRNSPTLYYSRSYLKGGVEILKVAARFILPDGIILRVKKLLKRYKGPRPFGTIEPVRPNFGLGHGQCIDRYYIETFLGEYAHDIQGHVLEIHDNRYTFKFGNGRVGRSDVLHVGTNNPQATIVADLVDADHIPTDTFDCIFLTQTLHYIYDVKTALRSCYRILKPGGVLLATAPCIQQIWAPDDKSYCEYWRFTTQAIQRLFCESFPVDCVRVQTYGNVFAATALLQGFVTDDVDRSQLDYYDPDYEMIVAVRSVKPSLR